MSKRFRTLSLPIPNVGVGQSVTFMPSPVQRARVRSLLATLNTGANVSGSLPVFQLLSSSGVKVYETGQPAAQAINSSVEYMLSPMFLAPVSLQGTASAVTAVGFPDFWLPPGWQIKLTNQQALDQWVLMFCWLELTEDIWDLESEEMEIEQLARLLVT